MNIQFWIVYVLQGIVCDDFVVKVIECFCNGGGDGFGEYYFLEFVEFYFLCCCKIGWDMYGLFGIGKGDCEVLVVVYCCNFEFFGVFIGFILMMYEIMWKGGWMDLGFYLVNVMVFVQVYGFVICLQVVWLEMEWLFEEEFDVLDDYQIVVGLLIGYED